jgi:putative GTP pyrophosphokinase
MPDDVEFDESAWDWSGASRFLMTYRLAIYEITTKLNILSEEFGLLHDYNPIERVSSRLKSSERIVAKARKIGCGLSVEEVRANIRDIADVPSGGAQHVDVELQFRTLAMDFWASLEHEIYYKYDRHVPAVLLDELKDAADAAARLDEQMERLHFEVSSEL